MSVIRIKRSGTNGNPSTLRAGELAYSAVTGNASNGGDRLYIGFGPETGGNALNHFVIGGKYFTDMLDHNKGQLTANSAIVVDSNSKIDNINIGNITVTGSTNTISSTDLDGNIVFHPNGTGYTEILGTNGLVIPAGTNGQRDETMPAGTIRYNLSLVQFEGWDGSTWTAFSGGSGGGGAAVRYDINTQGLTSTQQANVRTNIGLTAGTGISYNSGAGTINVDTNTIATRSYVTGLGYVTGSTLSGYNYITLASLSMDTPGTASGSGNVQYDNTTGKFKYTPPDLSSYITASVATLSSLTTIGSNGVDTTAAGNLIVSGNLTVNGTTETINSTTTTFADKNIELAKPVSPATASDAGANGGGITLHGTTDKTLNWVLSTTAWTSSENFDLADTKTYKINGNDVLSSTTLGSGVTGSSLTSVGTITSGTWHGSTIDNTYLTNSTIVVNGVTLTLGDTSDTIKASTTNALTIGTGLTGTSFDGSSAVTVAVDTTTIATKTYVTGLGYITLTSLSMDTPGTASGSGSVTYSNTTGKFKYTPPDLSGYLTSASTLDASKLSGTIPSSVLGNSTVYIGTTAIALNRASGSITLNGTSIDGNAGTVTNGVYTTGSYSDPSWLTISKSKVGLGNVENTALSTWVGSTSLTTLGTITTGVWHGTAIDNTYLANSSITIGTTSISLGSSSTTISGLTSIDATSSSTSFFDSPTSPVLFNSGTVISIGANTGTTTVNNNLVVGGNLTVNGTTETINATTSTFADKNIELAKPVSPAIASDASANGGGITLHGTTDKTLNWSLGTTSWTSSENFDLASGKTYKINGTDVLSSTTLGSGVTGSSLTSVGTLTNLTVTNTISGSVSGNAGTATKLYSAHRINGVGFDGSADITITATTTNQLLIGTGLTGISFNGSSEITIAIDSTVATKTYVTGLGYITGITSTDVTTALGYTPYNSTNPAGYITSAALVGYETTAALNTTLSDYVTNTSLTSTLSGYLHQSDLTVTTNPANGSGSLSYNNGTFTFTPPDLSSYITGTSTLNAAKLSGTIPSTVLGNSSVYIGTTQIALNRTSATETLNGVSIDGNAGTVTNGVYTSGSYSDPSWLTSLAWTKISGAPTIPTATKTVEMYQDGFLVLKTGTIRWYAPGNLTVTKIIGRLATPSDGRVTFKIKKNDSVTNTVDIVNPATKSTDLNGFNMVVDDYLTIDVTHTGTINAPGAGLSVVISYYLT
jgi:copper(I)-binding protein